ncbi:hypothetical protein GGQ84_002026 [Desulfitispora alkaliphila]|uniref:PPC domain-containing DNA-binding protein n=1 Tax=Desulfitispora alkaliphila TaxID=622674 RepID=UPI003D1A7467
MKVNEYKLGRAFVGCFDYEADLIESVEQFAKDNDIKVAQVRVIGAVKKAVIAYYHQDKKEYENVAFDDPIEVLACIGNLSYKDGNPKAHLHATFGYGDGKAIGGHLMPGTTVFFAEVYIQELLGEELHRDFDETTGLPAWKL